jgi:hypothetical protein
MPSERCAFVGIKPARAEELMTATVTRSVRSGFTGLCAQSGHGHLGQSRARLLPGTPGLLGARLERRLLCAATDNVP